MKRILVFSLLLFVLGSCNNNPNTSSQTSETNKEPASFVVLESINAAGYVYILGDEEGTKKWFALTARKVQKGDVFFYENPLVMTDFYSKELDRPFDEVLFLSRVSKNALDLDPEKVAPQKRSSGKITTDQLDLQVAIPESAKSIAQLYENKEDFKGQKVKVHGQVIKFFPQIMNTNWIHIQDGTSFNGKYDLTITSKETVQVGDEITFEGVIAVDKDFGYGYFYELLLEKAQIIK